MRLKISLGDKNNFGVKVVGGPYPSKNGRGNSTKWDFLCPVCNTTFLSPTTKFKSCKSCYGCRGILKRSYKEDTTWDYLYHVVKGRKVSNEKGFGLTKDCFRKISSMNCYYCGQPPTYVSGYQSWHKQVKINGLDRINPSMGYYDNNVVACCKHCNVAKLDRTVEEFISWIRKVAIHQQITM